MISISQIDLEGIQPVLTNSLNTYKMVPQVLKLHNFNNKRSKTYSLLIQTEVILIRSLKYMKVL